MIDTDYLVLGKAKKNVLEAAVFTQEFLTENRYTDLFKFKAHNLAHKHFQSKTVYLVREQGGRRKGCNAKVSLTC